MKARFGRRSSAVMLVGVFVLGLAACGSSGSSTSGKGTGGKEWSGQTLTIMGLGADVQKLEAKGIGDRFTQETGATIKWIPGAAPDNLAKLLAARQSGSPPADVVVLDNTTQPIAASQHVIMKADYSKLLADYSDYLPSAWQLPGYGPGFQPLALSICYNKNVYKKLGLADPTSLNDWFNPALHGKVAVDDSTSFYFEGAMPSIANAYGVSYSDPNPIMRKFANLKPQTLTSSSSQDQQLVQSGSVPYATMTNGRCASMQLAGAPVGFAPVNIKVGGKTWKYMGLSDTVDIVNGVSSSMEKLAAKFIDLYTSVGQVPHALQTGYAVTRKSTLAELESNAKVGPWLKQVDVNEIYYPDFKSFQPHLQEWTSAWSSIVK